jgi:hypothetical protein
LIKKYQDAIDSLLARIAEAKDAAEASKLAEVVINLTHAAIQLEERIVAAAKEAIDGEADNGSSGS